MSKKKNDYEDIVDNASNVELSSLRLKNLELEIQNAKYKDVLLRNNLLSEEENLSDIEQICISEIRKLKIISNRIMLNLNEVKALDTLHTNLMKVRGANNAESSDEDSPKKDLTNKDNIADLLSIVKK